MTKAERQKIAGALGCTERMVRTYIASGMPGDMAGALAWRARHVNPTPRRGGKIKGAGRPAGTKNKDAGGKTPDGGLDRAARLALLPLGKLTKAQVDQTHDETRAIEAVRAADLEAGRTLDAEATRAAWGELLAAHKGDLDGLAARAQSKAGAQLRLSPEAGKTLRGILEDEVAEIFKRLLAGEWTK